MATKRMLIDATHPEETRVVVMVGNRLEEFDTETAARRQLKGNIYLAKVTRVEPSLQAAFVDYGGNRHGFLPFSEIHPDYYRIPIADREALLAEEARLKSELAEAEVDSDIDDNGDADDGPEQDSKSGDDGDAANGNDGDGKVEELATQEKVDDIGGDDVEDVRRRRAALMRRYKIQEVIKRGQVLLVQVTKEERGNKGAALTTYLSLAGRYCVLMPNTPRGGGISRKINSSKDRKRLKSILAEMDIPGGMAVIVRTAGSQRSKAEIKRDYDYLLRLWSGIRETTLQSLAPALIHEEGNLIKRSLRDLYTRETDEVLVEGDDGYKLAKTFMKQLTPSHARKVQQYKDDRIPLFHRFQVESQLDAIHSQTVQMRSGGYIVMNQTEALVAIDVNSGRATRERHIEETALKTNLEAADEVARQLRLRDLAGLIVVDFIDMDETRHNREVERRLKDAMKNDRARIQLGRISPFGLLELSRQRLRPSLVETFTEACAHCHGTGRVRSTESAALQMLRVLEEEGIKKTGGRIVLSVPNSVALFIFNNKRKHLAQIEERYGFAATIEADDSLIAPDYGLRREEAREGEGEPETEALATLEERPEAEERKDEERKGEEKKSRRGRRRKSQPAEKAQEEAAESEPAEQPAEEKSAAGQDEEDQKPKKRRRRGKRGGRRRSKRRQEAGESREGAGEGQAQETEAQDAEAASGEPQPAEAQPEEKPKRRSRRKKAEPAEAQSGEAQSSEAQSAEAQSSEAQPGETPSGDQGQAEAKPKRRTRKKKAEPQAEPQAEAEAAKAEETEAKPDSTGEGKGEAAKEKPRRRTKKAPGGPAKQPATASGNGQEAEGDAVVVDVDEQPEQDDDGKPKRKGWWNRLGM